ncbi:TPA: integrating conjugative element protein, partial [Escherichia coli]
RVNTEQLVRLVNGQEKPTAENLAKLKTGSLAVSAGVIHALRRDPDNMSLTSRLAGELAMAHTVETALVMRRMLLTGMSEPYAAAEDAAIQEGDRRIAALDREIMALKNEMELKRDLARNSVLTIIERDNERVGSNPMIQPADNTDSRVRALETPDGE